MGHHNCILKDDCLALTQTYVHLHFCSSLLQKNCFFSLRMLLTFFFQDAFDSFRNKFVQQNCHRDEQIRWNFGEKKHKYKFGDQTQMQIQIKIQFGDKKQFLLQRFLNSLLDIICHLHLEKGTLQRNEIWAAFQFVTTARWSSRERDGRQPFFSFLDDARDDHQPFSPFFFFLRKSLFCKYLPTLLGINLLITCCCKIFGQKMMFCFDWMWKY